ncbi:hypothetical protein [Flavobacterium sp. SLB02]|jgi:hypothetical protein|uniref:hypothetical protein n=1 Tax=Flavobacterium sp. SLB02 TaxID=2665645 RepID=UPI0012A7F9C4|nr:hypothetical protein [Flavobacterium sp. SLB02]QGK75483.1 hypothetical protein GIY83_15790 [Flavobacterium sp. SLB02]
MEYVDVVTRLSAKTGIDRNIFYLNFEKCEELGLAIVNSHKSNHYYLSKYEYWQNSEYGGWKSVALFVPKEVIAEFLAVLNEVLHELGEEIIDLNNIPEQFSYVTDDGMFNILLGQKDGDYYRIDFAQRNR